MESIVGQRFGAWTVIGLSRVQKLCKPYWVVECDCGTLSRATKGDLTRGKTKRCKDCSINRLRVANPTKTDQVYNVWCSMKARCYRTTNAFWQRIKRGWTPQEAASTPRRKKPARLVCSD